ncbi:NupC/NupG family nucleoside CNT transporter [Psychroflexus sp. MES1-P1E]|uniref:NupC/NupG family nucleoside CNT transporter n=1 Tax=Psychroflexus sp. MES1-P1E TaxID=2058320 RepID=UPI000C7C2C88|nr:nucleoside transporter C-terminal domain-containing protein [Psychroflexus sp. MES1-P1E]PKG43914.1 Na+ dependent nucleoside transporter [Psychroflexus sp. MES1-P1E]
MKHLTWVLLLCLPTLLIAQNIQGTWEIDIKEQKDSVSYFEDEQTIEFLDSVFTLRHSTNDLAYQGSFSTESSELILEPRLNSLNNIVFDFQFSADSVLNLTSENFKLKLNKVNTAESISEIAASKVIIPNQNFSFNSLWRGVLGMFSLLFIAYILSKNKKAINWKTVGFGLLAQLILAVGVLKIPFVQSGFEFVGNIFVKILDFTATGSEFLLGGLMDTSTYGYIFIFQILPTIIFFSALTSILFYLGIIQKVVSGLAWVLSKLLGISGAESLSVAGNIFLGQTEAPLMIKAYLERMTRSEILLVMIGGMATVAGGVLAAYIGFLGGDDPVMRLAFAKHLLAASVMAAPGAIVISKILYPQQEKINTNVEVSSEKIGSNILDAIANGTTEGLKLAANVAAMLLVFVALIAFINYGFEKIGDLTNLNVLVAQNTPYDKFSLEAILGIIFAPLMWLIGVAKEDVMLMGQLLGIKLVASEFVGYIQLAELKNTANALSLNFEKSVIMATYMLCGFANFASIGIQIGGIGSLAPGQRKVLSEFGIRALIGGTLASLMSATIAGMIIG